MEILKWLDQAEWVAAYEVQEYKRWTGGMYYRLKIVFIDQSALFVREYVDESERVYSFHWQNEVNELILRWDNAPHHAHLSNYPHHKHTPEGVFPNREIALTDVLAEIERILLHTAD